MTQSSTDIPTGQCRDTAPNVTVGTQARDTAGTRGTSLASLEQCSDLNRASSKSNKTLTDYPNEFTLMKREKRRLFSPPL